MSSTVVPRELLPKWCGENQLSFCPNLAYTILAWFGFGVSLFQLFILMSCIYNNMPTKYCYAGSLLWPKNVMILVDLNLLILWGPAPETSSLQLSQTRIIINALFLILKTSMHVVVWFLGGLQSPVTKTQDEKSLGSCLEKISREIPGEGPASVFF